MPNWRIASTRSAQFTPQREKSLGAAIYIPLLPPKDEQRAIAGFLDRETAKIDALIAKVRVAIVRLKELTDPP